MTWFIFLFIGFGVGYVVGKKQSGSSTGSGSSTTEATRRKEAAKRRVMEMFVGAGEVVNDQVQKALGVSDATATNYLSELEAEGKIVQIGREGSGVRYRKNG